MKQIRIEKITINIGVGGPGEKMDKATRLLKALTGKQAKQTSSNRRIPSWGVRPKLPIACMVTIRGKKECEELLRRLLYALNNKISSRKFDDYGNFSFGIDEYINIKNLEYDPTIGIIGLEIAVTLERPGYRIKRRKLKAASVPKKHRIGKQEGIDYIKNTFNIEVAA